MQPYITVTSAAGASRRLPVVQTTGRDGEKRPVPIQEQPSEAIPTPIVIGNTEQRSSLDTSQIIFSDWRGGMGRDEYTETEGIADFHTSECETRYGNVLVCPPLATQLTGSVPFSLGNSARAVYLGYTNAEIAVWNVGGEAAVYGGGAWTQITDGGSEPPDAQWIVRGLTATYLISTSSSGTTWFVARSTDGTTWTDITGTGLAATPNLVGLAVHDNKVCVLATDAANSRYTLYTSTDAHTSATPTWVARESFYYEVGHDRAYHLFTWIDPTDPDSTALWCLTNRRLWYWDEQAATPGWKLWKDYRIFTNSASIVGVWAHRWFRNDNLYVTNTSKVDYLFEYAGTNTEGIVGPNVKAGLPAGTKIQIQQLDSNGHWLFAWGGIPTTDLTSYGALYAMNEQQGWHYLHNRAAATATVVGGCAGPDAVYTVYDDETVWKIDLPDQSDLPQHASGRTYATGAKVHKSGWTDGGTKLLDKQLLHFHVDCDIPSDAQVRIGYQLTEGGSITYAGTLTSASTLPAVVDVTSEVLWKRIRVVIELTRGTATSATPIMRSVGLNYQRIPKVRCGYTVALDMSMANEAFAGDLELFMGYSRHSLRTWLKALAGKIVRVDFGGMLPEGEASTNAPGYTSITKAQLAIVPREDPVSGLGDYLCTFFDLTAPASG